LLVGLVSFGLASSSPAHAQRLAVVTVPAAGAPESPAQLLAAAAALDGGAGKRGAVTVVGDGVALARAARSRGAVAAAQLATMARVIDAGAEGWRAYLQVAVPFAASRLGKARSDAELLLPLSGGLELYADLSLRLGAALLSLGRVEEAEDALALSAAIDPEREVSLVEFSPDIVEAVARARKRQAPAAQLVIETPGLTGAAIEVDGVQVQKSSALPGPQGGAAIAPTSPPSQLSGAASSRLRLTVPRGQHVVVVRHRGYEDAAQAVRVPAEGAEVVLQLSPDRGALALASPLAGMSEEQATNLLESVLTFAEADEVLFLAASSRRGAQTLLAQRCGTGLRCTAVVEIDYARPGLPAALREAWSTVGRGELRYPPSLPSDSRVLPSRTAGGDGRCRLCRSPWLWAGVGIAVTSTILYFALSEEDPPVLIVDPGDF
jgi:hypothetical protein